MIRLIETYTIGCVATVRSDGAPAVSPKATFLVIDERAIAFANIRSQGTIENLRRCPDVEVNFINVFARTGCRVKGRAGYVLLADADVGLRTKFKDAWPDLYDLIQGIVTIDITAAEPLSSPSYDVGAVAGQLTDYWLRRYASSLDFAVAKQNDNGLLGISSALEDAEPN